MTREKSCFITLLLASNLGRVTWTPGPSGQAQTPKRGFLPNLSPPGVLEQGGPVIHFRIGRTRQIKTFGSRILIVCPRPKETGLAGGSNLNFGFSTFIIKVTPPKIRPCCFWFCATFWSNAPKGPMGTPPFLGGVKIKSQNWGILRTFCFIQFLIWYNPEGLQAHQNHQKGVCFQVC